MARLSLLVCSCVLLFVLMSSPTTGCPGPRVNPNRDYHPADGITIHDQSENEFTVKAGEEFAISLVSNPTTGYTWMLKDDAVPSGLELLGCHYKRGPHHSPDGHPLVGSGGHDIWGFKGVSGQKIKLELQEVRPWVKPRPEKIDATFTITVE